MPKARTRVSKIGDVFHRLTVVSEEWSEYLENSKSKQKVWKVRCQCSCGNILVTNVFGLFNGSSKSCGCLQKESARNQRLLPVIGETFNRLTVVEDCGSVADSNGSTRSYVMASCSCGIKRYRYDQIKSCGCFHKEVLSENKTHGQTKSPTYHSWQGAKDRCTNPNNPAYPEWGGRGIAMCDEWLNSFSKFYEDMGD